MVVGCFFSIGCNLGPNAIGGFDKKIASTDNLWACSLHTISSLDSLSMPCPRFQAKVALLTYYTSSSTQYSTC